MQLYTTDPLSDARWDDLVARHPATSAFHTRGWLQALHQTYGYRPFVLTSTAPGEPLRDGIVLCRVSSWITGNRAVSLPFADHCEPLLEDSAAFTEFAHWLEEERRRQHWKYVELRPLSDIADSESNALAGRSYCFHSLDLSRPLEEIFRRLHKDSVQRRIRHAERVPLSYEVGLSKALLNQFYHLLLITRRRHHLFPQPRVWFRNLAQCLGDKMQIRIARKGDLPIAGMLTLRCGSTAVYKYGCSNARHHNLAAMPLLFWRLIEESKAAGVAEIDFGRSDWDNAGLIRFKDRFGTTRRSLKYVRYSISETAIPSPSNWAPKVLSRLLSILPDAALPSAGRALYRHIG